MSGKPPRVHRSIQGIIAPFFSILLFVAILTGIFFVWGHTAVYIKTSCLTIIGGAFVFVLGQVVQKGYIEPIQELQRTIGEIASAVQLYSNTADSNLREDLAWEATRALRKLSGDLLGKRRVIPHYKTFENLGFVPTTPCIKEAAAGLILMSNSVGSHSFDSFDKGRERIKKALRLNELF